MSILFRIFVEQKLGIYGKKFKHPVLHQERQNR